MIQEHFADRKGVKLHYLSSGSSSELTPLVYVPGFGSDAQSFGDEMKRLSPRRTVGVGKRGLGKSSVTQTGYSFEEQVADLASVIEHAGVSGFCLMAFSMGVPIALGYALERPSALSGLILLDYRAHYPQLRRTWAEQTAQVNTNLSKDYLFGSQQASQEVQLWDRLSSIPCPVLVIRGGKSSALTADEGKRYLSTLPKAQLITFEDSGHEVYKPDYERFIVTIENFLKSLD